MMPFMLIQIKIQTNLVMKVKVNALGTEYLYVHY